MTTQHVSHDGKGEVRIYAALDGCSCPWCTNQRKEHASRIKIKRRNFSYHHDEDHSPLDPQHAGELLNRYAMQLQTDAQDEGKTLSYKAALEQACKENPEVAKFYSNAEYSEDGMLVKSYSPDGGLHGGDQDMSASDAGALLDRAAVALRKNEPHLSYREAFMRARADHPDWADSYDRIGRIA